MLLAKIGRWAFGLYGPAVPDDLRLTATGEPGEGLTPVISRVEIPPERTRRLQARQQRQHDRMNALAAFVGEREVAEAEQSKQPPEAL